MQKISPCLWFNDNAEEAVAFYRSVFSNSKILDVMHYTDAGPRPAGSVLTITFQLEDQTFIALNGGPHYTFSPAISLFVRCETQQEVDELWVKLSDGGKTNVCGWLTDRFGVSWQIVPRVLEEILSDKEPERSTRVMQALLKMEKLDIHGLRRAYDGE